MKLAILSSLLPILLLAPACAASVEYQFFPHANCVGAALVCKVDRPGQCCGQDQPSASMKGIWPSDSGIFYRNLRLRACAGRWCDVEPCYTNPTRGNRVCFNTPYAVHSASTKFPILWKSSEELDDALASKPEKCAQPKWITWIGKDGEQLEAEIPEGRYEELYEAVKNNDLEKLNSLGGRKKDAVLID